MSFYDKEPQLQNPHSAPVFANVALVKTRENNRHFFQGYASGCRSALIQEKRRWYRIKGCGNHSDGFIEEKVVSGYSCSGGGNDNNCLPATTTIRGCMFEDTCFTELRMSRRVMELTGLQVANVPVGYYVYHDEIPVVITGVKENNNNQDDLSMKNNKSCPLKLSNNGIRDRIFELLVTFPSCCC